MEEKITTLHPEGKQGVNISMDKYTRVKDYIINTLSCNDSMSYEELNATAQKDLSEIFEGSVSWFILTIKLDLEARGIIVSVPQKSGYALKLK